MGWVLFVLEFYVSCARSDCGVIPKLARNVLLFPLLKSQRARSSRKVGAGDTAPKLATPSLRPVNGTSQWCFPNRDDSAHVCDKAVTKQPGDRQRGDATPMSRRSPYTNALALPGGK
jgi:hypothetical protein